MAKVITVDITNEKSVLVAIKAIQRLQKDIKKAKVLFLRNSAQAIIDSANMYLMIGKYSFDEYFINQIQSQWVIGDVVIRGNNLSITVENTADKAVWFEFGTGFEGANSPYPNDNEPDNYEYDVNAHGAKGWYFKQTGAIDIPNGKYTVKKSWVHTKGYSGELYLYNALSDFMANKEYESVWQSTLKELGY